MNSSPSSVSQPLIDFIRSQVVSRSTLGELRDLIARFPTDNEEACGIFCVRYELGDWFYEALVLRDININDLLTNIGIERERDERMEAQERAQLGQDYERAQGWPR